LCAIDNSTGSSLLGITLRIKCVINVIPCEYSFLNSIQFLYFSLYFPSLPPDSGDEDDLSADASTIDDSEGVSASPAGNRDLTTQSSNEKPSSNTASSNGDTHTSADGNVSANTNINSSTNINNDFPRQCRSEDLTVPPRNASDVVQDFLWTALQLNDKEGPLKQTRNADGTFSDARVGDCY
jgi:hypothetical protein